MLSIRQGVREKNLGGFDPAGMNKIPRIDQSGLKRLARVNREIDNG
jgi:hypothetical protein